MQRKGNIAVFSSDWNDELQSKLVAGIWETAEKEGYSISLFSCQGGKGDLRKHDIGEYQIYELPDLKRYDGVILAAHTIMSEDVKKKLVQRIQNSHIPVVSLEERYPGFVFVGGNNYGAMHDLIRHLITEHGFQDIYYLTGPADNYESSRRLEAYLDITKEFQLEQHVYYGDYTFESGVHAAQVICDKEKAEGIVIVCANDTMALGVCRELKRMGIEIPSEAAVTGFDDIGDTNWCMPGLTSVDRTLEEVGKTACSTLLSVIRGEKFEDTECETKLVTRGSCGCPNDRSGYGDDLKEHAIWMKYLGAKYNAGFQQMYEETLECNRFDELMRCICRNLSHFMREEMSICLNKSVYEQLAGNGKPVPEEFKTGYEEEIYGFRFRNGKMDSGTFPLGEGFFDLWNSDKECDIYLFQPLHFRDNTLGYVVLNGSLTPLTMPSYLVWIKNISSILEMMKNRMILSDLSARDSLTGLYNRLGMERFIARIPERIDGRRDNLLFEFIDIDNLKKINDNYGHEAGDQAICMVSKVLTQIFNKEECVIRYGGDEFLVIAGQYTEREIQEKNVQIDRQLKELAQRYHLAYPVEVSKGYYIKEYGMQDTLEQCMQLADEKMYQNKRIRKQGYPNSTSRNSL